MSAPFKKIVLDVQHGFKFRKYDPGATHGDLIEAKLCLEYASVAYHTLTAAGHEVFLVTSGSYGQRAAWANQINTDLYLSCHLNSSEVPPTTHYPLVEISEYAGELTRAFAQYLVDVFGQRLPVERSRIKIIKNGERGWGCINRVKAPALLLEPMFINRLGSHVTQDMVLIGKAIAEAVEGFNYDAT